MRGAQIEWGWFAYESDEVDADGDKIIKYREIPLPDGGVPAIEATLKEDARRTLGGGQPFEIRRAIPHTYGRGHGMAWVEGHETPDGLDDYVLGYRLVGKYLTASAAPD